MESPITLQDILSYELRFAETCQNLKEKTLSLARQTMFYLPIPAELTRKALMQHEKYLDKQKTIFQNRLGRLSIEEFREYQELLRKQANSCAKISYLSQELGDKWYSRSYRIKQAELEDLLKLATGI